jgi:GTP pyrophosphokinase
VPSSVHNVQHVLAAHPAVAALPRRLRALLDEALEGAGDGPDGVLAELADTLDSLSLLNADGETVLAAILYALPDAAPAVAALLDGQRAANQVWALHAERAGQGGAEGLRRLLLAIVRDLRVVPILLARQLAQLRTASQRPEAERRALAQLTRDIHAPLANRLGI